MYIYIQCWVVTDYNYVIWITLSDSKNEILVLRLYFLKGFISNTHNQNTVSGLYDSYTIFEVF